jgi:hypothetical protein
MSPKNQRIYSIVLGILAIVFVPILLLWAHSFGLNTTRLLHPEEWYTSVSINYYTNARPIMITFIIIIALLTLLYPSKTRLEKILRVVIFVSALGVIAFPCKDTNLEYVGLFQLPRTISSGFHYFFAGTVFALSTVIFLVIYPKEASGKKQTLFIIIGTIMLISCVGFFIHVFIKFPNYYIIIFETTFFMSFGVGYIFKEAQI